MEIVSLKKIVLEDYLELYYDIINDVLIVIVD